MRRYLPSFLLHFSTTVLLPLLHYSLQPYYSSLTGRSIVIFFILFRRHLNHSFCPLKSYLPYRLFSLQSLFTSSRTLLHCVSYSIPFLYPFYLLRTKPFISLRPYSLLPFFVPLSYHGGPIPLFIVTSHKIRGYHARFHGISSTLNTYILCRI